MSDPLQHHGLQHARPPCHHQLPKFTQTHVHWVSDPIQPSHPLSSPSSPTLTLSLHDALPISTACQASLSSPTPGVYPNTCPMSWWCHPTISSSVVPFSSQVQSFPASGSFPVSQFFSSGGQSIGVSASTSVLPMNTQDWSLGWTGLISLQSKGLSRVFSNTTVQKHQLTLTSIHDYWKNHSFD